MKIEITNTIEGEDLVERIRQVPLLQEREGKKVYPYENAHIQLRSGVSPLEVNPPTKYLLSENVDFQQRLRAYMIEEYGIDHLNLDRALELVDVNTGNEYGLLPIIIETMPTQVTFQSKPSELVYTKSDIIQIPVIADGAHRAHRALLEDETFSTVWISGGDPNFPYYAFPNSWARVKIVEKTPEDMRDKKNYRKENSYGLYRDFGVFKAGKPRSKSQ